MGLHTTIKVAVVANDVVDRILSSGTPVGAHSREGRRLCGRLSRNLRRLGGGLLRRSNDITSSARATAINSSLALVHHSVPAGCYIVNFNLIIKYLPEGAEGTGGT